MSVSYLKVICAWSWGYIEAFGDLRSAKNKLTATLFLIHNQMNHPVVYWILKMLGDKEATIIADPRKIAALYNIFPYIEFTAITGNKPIF